MQLLEEFYAAGHKVRHVRPDNLKFTPFHSLLKVYPEPHNISDRTQNGPPEN